MGVAFRSVGLGDRVIFSLVLLHQIKYMTAVDIKIILLSIKSLSSGTCFMCSFIIIRNIWSLFVILNGISDVRTLSDEPEIASMMSAKGITTLRINTR